MWKIKKKNPKKPKKHTPILKIKRKYSYSYTFCIKKKET